MTDLLHDDLTASVATDTTAVRALVRVLNGGLLGDPRDRPPRRP